MKTALLLVSLTLLPSCALRAGGAPDCLAWRPILFGDADQLTPETAREILAHNRTGRRLCGW